jgi:hypothetical protein
MSFQHNESLEAVSLEEGVVQSPVQGSTTSRNENTIQNENTEQALVPVAVTVSCWKSKRFRLVAMTLGVLVIVGLAIRIFMNAGVV